MDFTALKGPPRSGRGCIGQRMGDFFDGFVDTQARDLGVTRDDLADWEPVRTPDGAIGRWRGTIPEWIGSHASSPRSRSERAMLTSPSGVTAPPPSVSRWWRSYVGATTDGTMILDPNFSEFIGSLHAREVRFLIVGGYAVGIHGHPRYTADLDIWLGADEAYERRVDVRLGDLVVPVISLDDLRRNKKASGRMQDLADLEALEDESA